MAEADLIGLFAAPLEQAGLPYMVTGAAAAILYGQPAPPTTWMSSSNSSAPTCRASARRPEADYYLPPDEVIEVELRRTLRGHLNALNHESGFKADLYPVGNDALHYWAFPQRRPVEHGGQTIRFAPPKYVILRKLEYFREGGSTKHLSDIRAMLDVCGESLDRTALIGWIIRLGLRTEWQRAETAGN